MGPEDKHLLKTFSDAFLTKTGFGMELLNNLPFVKTKSLTPSKAQFLEEIKEAVDNITLVKQGKLKARSAKELLDEL